MTEETRRVLMRRFERIISKLAMQDYLKANTNKQGKLYKKHRPYSLSRETLEAKELYKILYFDDSFNNLTREQEEKIKGYLLLNRGLWQEV